MDRVITYAQAVREATEQEMLRDPSIVVFGEGAQDPTITYGTTAGLLDRFGQDRVFDTPLAEEGMTGVYYANSKLKKSSSSSYDTRVAGRLWQASADLVGLSTRPPN